MGRVHDQVSRLVRRRKISINKGKKLIEKYDGEFPHEYAGVKIKKILKEMNISKQKFNGICFNYTNEKLFIRKSSLLKNT